MMGTLPLNEFEMDFLRRLKNGWRPLWLQVGTIGKRLEKHGLVKADYGPADSADRNKLCVYITPKGRSELE